jgi:hypothetical protein
MEYGFKVAFGLVSLTIGETFTPAALLLVPLLIWLIWRGIRIRAFRPPLVPLIVIASLMGYIGAARWVAWPFVAARLLWLLPFLTLALSIGLTRCHPTARSIVTAAVFLSFAFSALSYFRRENFVNLGYVAPLRELAARIRSEASPHDVVIADGYNADAESIRYYLGFLGNGPAFVALTRTSSAQARVMASAPGVRAVWIVRNTRDVSPERLITNIETDACRGRSSSESLYEPFPSWERGVMQVVTGVPAPLYFYRITVCR